MGVFVIAFGGQHGFGPSNGALFAIVFLILRVENDHRHNDETEKCSLRPLPLPQKEQRRNKANNRTVSPDRIQQAVRPSKKFVHDAFPP